MGRRGMLGGVSEKAYAKPDAQVSKVEAVSIPVEVMWLPNAHSRVRSDRPWALQPIWDFRCSGRSHTRRASVSSAQVEGEDGCHP